MKPSAWLCLALNLLLTVSLSAQKYSLDPSRPEEKIRKQFPFDIELKMANGEKVLSPEVLKPDGKPLVMLFWLTTCVPCRFELQAIQQKYKEWQSQVDFKLVAISTDFQENFPAFVRRVEESNWPFPAYNDWRREFRYVMPGELNGLPQVFVLDKAGNIAFHKRKYAPGDEDQLFEAIRQASLKP